MSRYSKFHTMYYVEVLHGSLGWVVVYSSTKKEQCYKYAKRHLKVIGCDYIITKETIRKGDKKHG